MTAPGPPDDPRKEWQQSLPDTSMLGFEDASKRIIAPVELDWAKRKMTMHSVTEEELSTLRAIGPTLSVAFLGLAAGFAFSLWTSLKSTGLSDDTRRDFESLYFFARLVSVFFGLFAIAGYGRLWHLIYRIKQREGATR